MSEEEKYKKQYDKVLSDLVKADKKIEKKDKIIDEIISFLVTRTWATCPNEDCGANIDCKKRCKVDIEEECWKIYFENKVNSSEQ